MQSKISSSNHQAKKSQGQLPLIKKQTQSFTSPLLQRMKSLHNLNIRTIRKQQMSSHKAVQSYLNNKTNYLNQIEPRRIKNIEKVLKSLQNKSTFKSKENSTKMKAHQEMFRKSMEIKQNMLQKITQKQNMKSQNADLRRSQYRNSTIKHKVIEKPDYLKKQLEALNSSSYLFKKTISRLKQAQDRRNIKKQEKKRKQLERLGNSRDNAQQFAYNLEQQMAKRRLDKSIQKIVQAERLMNESKSRIHSNSNHSKKRLQQKLIRAKNIRSNRQNQLIQKLQKILQQKQQKTQEIISKKTQRLSNLSSSIQKIRNQQLEQAHVRTRSMYLDQVKKTDEMVQESQQKWIFLTGIKIVENTVRNSNLYETQQVSLRG